MLSVRAPLSRTPARAPALKTCYHTTKHRSSVAAAAQGSSGEGVQRWSSTRGGVPSVFSLLNDLDMNLDPFSALAMQLTAPSAPEKYIAMDIFETDDHIEIHADMPGVKKENIKIESNKDILTLSVSSETKNEGEEEHGGKKWYKSERSSSFMRRSVRLPEYADASKASANYENGVCAIRIPKMKEQTKSGTMISIE